MAQGKSEDRTNCGEIRDLPDAAVNTADELTGIIKASCAANSEKGYG